MKVEVISLLSCILYCFLAAVCILFGAYCLSLYFKRRQRTDIVYDNSAFFLMLISGVGLGVMVLYLLLQGEAEIALVPAVAAALCLLGLLSWHNEVVVFGEQGFTRRDLLFRSRRWSYRDITDISERILRQSRKRQEVQTLFYLGDKRFSLSRKSANYSEFAKYVHKYGSGGLNP